MKSSNIYDDYELLTQLRDGNEKAFSIIFNTYHRYLYILACRYLMSDSFAEDAVQYTFLRLWEKRDTFDYRKGIKNLLFTILKNHILNEIRHNNMAIQKNYELSQYSKEMEDNLFKDLEEADFRIHLYKLINELPPQKQAVCLLKIKQGMSNQEIADTMKISVPTVKSHFTEAIKILRSQIDKIISIILLYKFYI